MKMVASDIISHFQKIAANNVKVSSLRDLQTVDLLEGILKGIGRCLDTGVPDYQDHGLFDNRLINDRFVRLFKEVQRYMDIAIAIDQIPNHSFAICKFSEEVAVGCLITKRILDPRWVFKHPSTMTGVNFVEFVDSYLPPDSSTLNPERIREKLAEIKSARMLQASSKLVGKGFRS